MAKRIIVLGSTGSIGTSTLDVARDFPDRFKVVGLSALSQTDLLSRQVEEFRPEVVCISDSGAAQAAGLGGTLHGAELLVGEDATVELVRKTDADILVVSTVGYAGLLPTLAGIERGMAIALANKEVLVVAGEIVMERARQAGRTRGARILRERAMEAEKNADIIRRVIAEAQSDGREELEMEPISAGEGNGEKK